MAIANIIAKGIGFTSDGTVWVPTHGFTTGLVAPDYIPAGGVVVPVWCRGTYILVFPRGTVVRVTPRGDMDIPAYEKFVDDDLPYDFAFDGWPFLLADAIASAAVTGTPSGLTIGTPAISTDGRQVQVTIAAGTAGTEYTVKCVATTIAGRDVTGKLTLTVF